MKKLLVLLATLAAAVVAGSSSTDALGAPAVACNNCDGGGGAPNCSDLTLGWTYTDGNGRTWYCARVGYYDVWI